MNTSQTDLETRTSRFPKWAKWVVSGGLGLVVLAFGAFILWITVFKDSPAAFDEEDLAAALEQTAPPAAAPAPAHSEPVTPAAGPSNSPTAAQNFAEESAASADPLPAGATTWTLSQPSEAGYRVKEILLGLDTEGVGRTSQIDGAIAIDGTSLIEGKFIVDVGSITSDQGNRDSQFRRRIMTVSEFPTATFTLTEPIELGAEPADGIEATVNATGDLMLRGVTNAVTFELTAQQANGRIGVLGSIPVVFADYGIDNPSNTVAKTGDDGLLEFVLVFDQD
jgi:polyisoprenoid-binding protein YceI